MRLSTYTAIPTAKSHDILTNLLIKDSAIISKSITITRDKSSQRIGRHYTEMWRCYYTEMYELLTLLDVFSLNRTIFVRTTTLLTVIIPYCVTRYVYL